MATKENYYKVLKMIFGFRFLSCLLRRHDTTPKDWICVEI